jgi:mRNA-degrading endonuclease RelE of RelBE toxin-antitoxin system
MTYRVDFHAKAAAETIGLPAEAFTALIETLAAASRDPYDQAVTHATDDPHIRRATFATFGLCSFHIDEDTRTLRVFDVTWTG